uniref:Thiamin biosynthesis protein S n=1 Tax=Alsidium seaforthii TaxID=2007182 RepID=A0A1Z1ME53_9FLOR|nr:thiamin biosynthesis protein S [Bryothamnion seaforthii]ARW64034.1 thiamin biosynthesis protein S [Bryothamnion seaforthii]
MQNYLTIFINGEPFNCNNSMSLTNILLYLDINIDHVLVEYNNKILDKAYFNSLSLKNHDCLEIITIVGGG